MKKWRGVNLSRFNRKFSFCWENPL